MLTAKDLEIVDAVDETKKPKGTRKRSTKKEKNSFATFWDSATTKGKNRVIQNKLYNIALDKVRADFSPDVMRAVIFGIEHERATDYLEQINEVKEKFAGKLPSVSMSDAGEYLYTDEEIALLEVAKRVGV